MASISSRHTRLPYMRRSVATWSLRLRAVCSFPATSPATSKRRRSMAMWMSSSPSSKTNSPLSSSRLISRSPASIAFCSSRVMSPMVRSMRACACEPWMSSG